jgi:hypothetical protein
MENVSLDSRTKDVFGIKRKVFEAFKILFLSERERRTIMFLEKLVPFLSPFHDALVLGNRFQMTCFLCQ